MSNESFEKWFENTVLNDNIHDVTLWAWQAAKADSEQEIAELKNEVIEKCANVADAWSLIGKSIAHEIRALKG